MVESKDEHLEDPPQGKRPAPGTGAGAPDPMANAIQWALDANSPSVQEKRPKKTRSARAKVAEGSSPKAKPSGARGPKVPDSVQERFIQIGNNFYFPDGAEAFRCQEKGLTTRSENAIVIQSMVAIAREENATGVIKVGGSEFFKKEAWFAAGLVGLQVEGYQPTEFERERLVRAMAARRSATPSDKEHATAGEDRAASVKDPPVEKPLSTHELITGRLVDHGPAPYRHNPKERPSYFVRIETERGDRDIWGVDLERAFRHSLSNPGIGDEIGIRVLGKEPVTVISEGRELDAHRNQWSVERKEFLDQRRAMAAVFRDASIDSVEGIKRHSGLEGSYRTLEVGLSHAQEQYKSQLHRTQFVEHLREYLAKSIEYGQPLEPARANAREDQTPEPRELDRDYHPTR